jgi:hypothetical protein
MGPKGTNLENQVVFKCYTMLQTILTITIKFEDEFENKIQEGSSMVKYAKKVVLKTFYFKKNLFSTLTLKKILKTYLNWILKS